MGAKSEELLIEYDYEFAAFGEGDDRVGISSAYVEENGERRGVTIKGHVPFNELKNGLTYRLLGRWIEHHKHGLQFVFSTHLLVQPASHRGVVRYLCQAPHVGPSTAESLWQVFGSDAIKVLRESPEKAAMSVGRFPVAKAQLAAEWLEEQKAIEGSSIDLFALLDGRGFPKTTIKAAIQKYGTRAARMLETNPYLTMQFPGVGFLRADRLYKDLGKNLARRKRQTMCIHHDLSTDSDGHTWFPIERSKSILKEKIDSTEIKVVPAIKLGIRGGKLKTCRDTSGQIWIADAGRAANEEYIADALVDSFDETPNWPDVLEEDQLTPHQRGKLMEATRGTIGILSGSPGSGKTFSAGRLIRAFAQEYGLDSVAGCAPTGKAAVRLTESLLKAGVRLDAKTIHRTLGVMSAEGGGWTFEHHEGNPLPYKLIVVDEKSMDNTDITASLLRARARDTHMLMIGDPEQLPPIGHGAPLRDMIAAGIPHGQLVEIRRNSGRIVKACKQIREECRFDPSPALDLAAADPENLLLINKWKPELQIASVEDLLNRFAAKGQYDPKWHVQILCAVNKKSPLARKTLNERLQGLLNPNGEQATGNPFRIGDKIICLKNYWAISEDENDELANDDGKVLVCNGEMAEVLKVEPNLTIAELQMPHRVVRIPRGKQESSGNGDEKDEEASDTGCNWDLGFAISAHKSQGSSWPIVVVMVDEYGGAQRVMSRQWIYTALSRAEKLCVAVGSKKTIDSVCQRDAISNRKTFLKEQIEAKRELVTT